MFTNTDFTGPEPDLPFTRATRGPVPTPDVVGYGDIHGAYLEVDDGLTALQRRRRRQRTSTGPARPTSSSRA